VSDTFCAVCERRIVCSGDGTTWWHWPDDFKLDGGLNQSAKTPYPHKAEPAEEPSSP
jgi:hypothetical protein